MLRCRVKFSLTIFTIFFCYLCSNQVQAARVRCDSECLENKIDEVLERLRVMTEPTTKFDLEAFLAEGRRLDQERADGEAAEAAAAAVAKTATSTEANTTTTTTTQQRRRNIQNTHSVRSISATTTNKDDSHNNNNYKCSERLAGICQTIGVSEIQPEDAKISPFSVLCDADRWIVVLQRFDGSVAFHNRTWAMYKQGFGSIGANSEFFLGLQHLHELTFNGFYELRIDMEDHEGVQKYAHYSDFSIFNEQTAYKMGILGAYQGTAGDSFMYHEGQQFSTMGRDNDAKSQGSCSEEYNSPGWFKSCMKANIFGKYMRGETDKTKEGMYWETFHGSDYSLKRMKMSIRAKC